MSEQHGSTTHDAPDGERIELPGGWRLDTPRPGWGWALRDPAGRHLVNMRDEDARAFAAALSQARAVPDGWAWVDREILRWALGKMNCRPSADKAEVAEYQDKEAKLRAALVSPPPARETVDLAEVERVARAMCEACNDYWFQGEDQGTNPRYRRMAEAAIRQLATPDTEGRLKLPKPDRDWAYRFATKRHGQSETPRCEPPTDYDIGTALKFITWAVETAPPPTNEAAKPLDPVAVRDGEILTSADGQFSVVGEIACEQSRMMSDAEALLAEGYQPEFEVFDLVRAYLRGDRNCAEIHDEMMEMLAERRSEIEALKSPADLPAGDAQADAGETGGRS